MNRLFLPGSPYTKQARFVAQLWTLLIFIGCLTPGHELPHVAVPFIDKWVHLVLFGGFSFLWLCAMPAYTGARLFYLFVVSVLLGCAIEGLQGLLSFLGRSMELMDAIADGVGAALGIALFLAAAAVARR